MGIHNCKTCRDQPTPEGPSTCSGCGRSSANGAFFSWDSDRDPGWQKTGGGTAVFDEEVAINALRMLLLWGMVALVGVLFALWVASPAKAQTRQCVDWRYQRVCGAEWPYSDCRRGPRYCHRHAHRETYRRNDDRVRYYRTPDDDDRSWNRRDPREERGINCKPELVRVVGAAALSDEAATRAAVRAWQSTVAYDHGQKWMELSNARQYRWRCDRASSNESVLGRVGEALAGDAATQKRCVILARPCMLPMKDGDKDDKQ